MFLTKVIWYYEQSRIFKGALPLDMCQQAVILAVMNRIFKVFGQTNKTKTISDIMYTKTKLNEYVHICLLPMQWVTEIKDVRCERKNHNILTLRTPRKVTYRKWCLDFCDDACGFYIRPTFHWCVVGTLSQICGIVIMLGKWNFQRHVKKLNRFPLNCMRKLLKIKWKDKIITFIYIIP